MLISLSSAKLIDSDTELSKLIGLAYIYNMGTPHMASTYLAFNQVPKCVLLDSRKKLSHKIMCYIFLRKTIFERIR